MDRHIDQWNISGRTTHIYSQVIFKKNAGNSINGAWTMDMYKQMNQAGMPPCTTHKN